MAIADVDESGTIDKKEFSAFIQKLDPETKNADEIFDEKDGGSGALNVDQFGEAIFVALKDMKLGEEEEAD